MDVPSFSGDDSSQGGVEKTSLPSLHRYSTQPLGDSRSTAPSSSSSRGHSADDCRVNAAKTAKSSDAEIVFRSIPGSGPLNTFVTQSPKNTPSGNSVSPQRTEGGVADLKTRGDRAVLVNKTDKGAAAQTGDVYAGDASSPFLSSSPSTGDLTVAAVSDEGTVSPPNGTESRTPGVENGSSAEGSGEGELKWDRAYCKHFLFGRCARRRCRFLHGDAEVVQQQRRLLEMDTAATAAAAGANGTTQSEDSRIATSQRQTRDRKTNSNASGGAVLVRNDDRRDEANKQGNRFFSSHNGNTSQPHRRGSLGTYTPVGISAPCRYVHYQQPNRNMNHMSNQEAENRCKPIPGNVHRGPPGAPGQAPYGVPFFYGNSSNGSSNPVRSPSPPRTYLTSPPMSGPSGSLNADGSGGSANFVSSQTFYGTGQGGAPWAPATSVPPPPASTPSPPFMPGPQTLYGTGGPLSDSVRRPLPPIGKQFPTGAEKNVHLRNELDFALALASAAAEELMRSEEKFSAAKAASAAAQQLAAQVGASASQGRQEAHGCAGFSCLTGQAPPGGFAGAPATPPSDLRFVQAAESLAERCNIPFVSVYLPGQGYIIQFVEGVAGTIATNRASGLAERRSGNFAGCKSKSEGANPAPQHSKEFPAGPLEKGQGAAKTGAIASGTETGDPLAAKVEKAPLVKPPVSMTRSWLEVLKQAPGAGSSCKTAKNSDKGDHAPAVGAGDAKATKHASANLLGLFEPLQEMALSPPDHASEASHAAGDAPKDEVGANTGWPSLTNAHRPGAQNLEEGGETRQTKSPLDTRDSQLLPNFGGDLWTRNAPLESGGAIHLTQPMQTVFCGRPQEALGLRRGLGAEGQQADLRQGRQSSLSALSSQASSPPTHTCSPSVSFANFSQVPEDRELKCPKGLGTVGAPCFMPSLSGALFRGSDKESVGPEGCLRSSDFLRLNDRPLDDPQKREAARGDVSPSLFLNAGAPLQNTLSKLACGSAQPFQNLDHPSLSLQQQMAAALSQAHTTTGGANTFSSGSFPWLISDFAASTTECGYSGLGESASDLTGCPAAGRGGKAGETPGLVVRAGDEGTHGDLFFEEAHAHSGLDGGAVSLRCDRAKVGGLKPRSPPKKLSGWFASAFQNRVGSDPRFFLDDFAEELARGAGHEEDKLSKMDTHFTLKSLDSRRNSGPGDGRDSTGMFQGDMSLSPTAALIASIWQKAGVDDDDLESLEAQQGCGVNQEAKVLSSF
uniref:Putative zinc finger protein n=1 Tax=Toxoplasma gondii COUG TaxID=1074873 RepID=A0A2G8XS98_TOXGO|nr:putative zinc finger protein [Toxoplasma gondii COUG]